MIKSQELKIVDKTIKTRKTDLGKKFGRNGESKNFLQSIKLIVPKRPWRKPKKWKRECKNESVNENEIEKILREKNTGKVYKSGDLSHRTHNNPTIMHLLVSATNINNNILNIYIFSI